MQAAASGIQCQFSDRHVHAARPLGTEPKNAFAVGDHNNFDLIETRVGKDRPNTVLVRHTEEQAAWPPIQAAELLVAGADRQLV